MVDVTKCNVMLKLDFYLLRNKFENIEAEPFCSKDLMGNMSMAGGRK